MNGLAEGRRQRAVVEGSGKVTSLSGRVLRSSTPSNVPVKKQSQKASICIRKRQIALLKTSPSTPPSIPPQLPVFRSPSPSLLGLLQLPRPRLQPHQIPHNLRRNLCVLRIKVVPLLLLSHTHRDLERSRRPLAHSTVFQTRNMERRRPTFG